MSRAPLQRRGGQGASRRTTVAMRVLFSHRPRIVQRDTMIGRDAGKHVLRRHDNVTPFLMQIRSRLSDIRPTRSSSLPVLLRARRRRHADVDIRLQTRYRDVHDTTGMRVCTDTLQFSPPVSLPLPSGIISSYNARARTMQYVMRIE